MPQRSSSDKDRLEKIMGMVENIRNARKKYWAEENRKGKYHPERRNFDFESIVATFPAYRNARRRPQQTLMFSRGVLLEICDYLDMDYTQKNEVLLMAEYVPFPYPLGADFGRALNICVEVMQGLPMPAYVLKPDWSIHTWNRYILDLLGLDRKYVQLLRVNGNLNILKLIFKTELGMREQFPDWEEVARQNIAGFITANVLAQNESWYISLRNSICDCQENIKLWNEVEDSRMMGRNINDGKELRNNVLEYITRIRVNSEGDCITFRSLAICPGDFTYPHVAAYLPADAATWDIFARLNIPIAVQRGL